MSFLGLIALKIILAAVRRMDWREYSLQEWRKVQVYPHENNQCLSQGNGFGKGQKGDGFETIVDVVKSIGLCG